MSRLTKLTLLAITVVGRALAGLYVFAYLIFPGAHRITLANCSGVSVKNVTWRLTDMDHSHFVNRHDSELKPGETIVIRHFRHDTRSRLRYEFNGKVIEEGPQYIDLWTGECWRYEIQPDGTLIGGWDYSGKSLITVYGTKTSDLTEVREIKPPLFPIGPVKQP